MLNNKGGTAVWIFVIILLAVGGRLLFLSYDGEGNDEAATSTEQATGTEAAKNENMPAIQEAIAGNGSVECAYNVSSQTANSYIKDREIRTITETESGTTNMFFSEGQIYVWQEGSTQGITFNAESVPDSNQTPILVRPNEVAEAARSEDVSCQVNRDVDDSLFVIPEDVTFSDSFSAGATSSNANDVPQQ